MAEARGFWVTAPGEGEIRGEPLVGPGSDQVEIRAEFSGISRGTEALVFGGHVPVSQHSLMRAPFQAGGFDFPVKYGYASVGRVVRGPEPLAGRGVFCLHPHQDRYVVPAAAVVPLPEGLDPERAVLGANMETALNGLWDAGPRLGARIAVVGAGVIGALVAGLAAKIPGTRVQLVDVDPDKTRVAAALGVGFATPAAAIAEVDLVVHASGSSAGLETALGLAGFEATILELSWYGDRRVEVPLGEAFHSRRLKLHSSQVGSVAAPMRPRRTHRDRLALALELLQDDQFAGLLEPSIPFDALPELMPSLLGSPGLLCQVVRYPKPTETR